MSNFSSAYNVTPALVRPTVYIPMATEQHAFHLPLRDSRSPVRIASPFSFSTLSDHNRHDFFDSSVDYLTPRSESSSPLPDSHRPHSTVVIHHHPVSNYHKQFEDDNEITSNTALMKLRQSNNQLSDTLAMLDDLSAREKNHHPPPPHHHHQNYIPSTSFNVQSPDYSNYPLSKHHTDGGYSSENDTNDQPKRHNAKVTYNIRGRRREPLSKYEQLMISTSDAYSSDDPVTYDIYPSGRGFVEMSNKPNNRNPWLVDGIQLPLNQSNTDVSPPRKSHRRHSMTKYKPKSPDGPNYNDKPIGSSIKFPKSREQPNYRSSFVQPPYITSQIRPDSAPSYVSDPPRSLSSSIGGPIWKPSGKPKQQKFMGSIDNRTILDRPPPAPGIWRPGGKPRQQKTIKAFDPRSAQVIREHEPTWNPTSKIITNKPVKYFDPRSDQIIREHEPTWNPTSKTVTNKPVKYFDPRSKPRSVKTYPTTMTKFTGGSQSELVQPQYISSTNKNVPKPKVQGMDPKLKKRISSAESKVKSAWEPSATQTGVVKPLGERKKIPESEDGSSPSKIQPRIKRQPPSVTAKKTKPLDVDIGDEKRLPKPTMVNTRNKLIDTTNKPTKDTRERTNTGWSSINDDPKALTKPIFQSTPINQSLVDQDLSDHEQDLLDNDTQTPKRNDVNVIPHSSIKQKQKTNQPETPTDVKVEQILPSVPESHEDTKDTIKDGVLIHGSDHSDREKTEKPIVIEKKIERKDAVPTPPERTLTPTSEPEEVKEDELVENNDTSERNSKVDPQESPMRRKDFLPKTSEQTITPSDNKSIVKDDVLIHGDNDIEPSSPDKNLDQSDYGSNARIHEWLNDQSKAPITDKKPTDRQLDNNSPNQSVDDETPELTPHADDIYRPPFGPKTSTARDQINDKEHEPQSASTKANQVKPATQDNVDDGVDDFFS
ncbi:unnamed protein product [Didymodactylos carnosus]|uniref:Uncharacterized protein n=1 Tax=Didymodactylos carnosus TaxID=1234261 RepID=A0A814V4F4_9BILA|nr:unnamed protein product [Didymodactylos carnosus]CAF1185128.1 unnamed protein product [Didymodactylos carnosus]CAF3949374.1 unnamed protein product [Didymodactylos carnosus]CAF3985271.1 unnamed protein product [Didymodactylos carnosus]